MKAAFIQETGPADKIIYGELPTPTPAGTQVRIKVGAVAVNPIDTYIRSGIVAANLPKPYIVGCDVAGEVEAVGPEVKGLKLGDRVWGTNQGLQGRQGTFAEQIVVDESWLYSTPAGVSDEAAAAVSLVGITAHLGLFRDAKLKAGETIFIRGGTGGVGAMVVQMAKAVGARVITTAGSADKAALAKELGADHVIEYRTQKLEDELKKVAPAGVQVWWETLNEPDFDLAVNQLAARGRLIVMAGRQARPIFPVGPFYVKGCSMHGFAMFNATPDEQRQCSVDINRWLSEGKLKARIDRVLPLSEAAAAHRLQEESTSQKSGALSGKIVLKP
ncbi:MAG: Alcohol dehydrogenase zinc-binding domain protein [Verrucomicrobia bacterium]|jgi:NADPH2:quinone reductase|nr:Alcohol dehydrogenase zinc-binding domain protein [Verrucomicrobiota bacterium]